MQNKVKNCLLICFFGILTVSIFADQKTEKQEKSLPNSIPTVVDPVPQIHLIGAYEVEAPLLDSSDLKERKQVFAKSLELVLIDRNGDSRIVEHSDIKDALSHASRYVKRFKTISRVVGENQKRTFLQMTFDQKAISQLLRRISRVDLKVDDDEQQKVSEVVWINSKPRVLLWLVKDIDKGKILTAKNDAEGIVAVFKKEFQGYGIPVISPMLDLYDIDRVKPGDICSFNTEAIKKASSRYGLSTIIIGCIQPYMLGRYWYGQWQLLQGEESKNFGFYGGTIENVIAQATKAFAKSIPDIAKPVVAQDSSLLLRITNVNNLEQYGEVMKYLRGFTVIKRLNITDTSAQSIKLKIDVVGGKKVLLNILDKQNKLVPNIGITNLSPNIDLDYKWITAES